MTKGPVSITSCSISCERIAGRSRLATASGRDTLLTRSPCDCAPKGGSYPRISRIRFDPPLSEVWAACIAHKHTLDSIGREPSSGCIRMRNENVEGLYDRVEKSAAVVVQ